VREVPALEKIQTEYRNRNVEVIAVNIFPSIPLKSWKEYLKKFGAASLLAASDTKREAVKALNIRSSGATVIINKEGKVVYQDGSATPYDKLKFEIDMSL